MATDGARLRQDEIALTIDGETPERRVGLEVAAEVVEDTVVGDIANL